MNTAPASIAEQWSAGGVAERAGLIGLMLFAFMGVQGPAGTAFGLLLLAGAAAARPAALGRALRDDPVFWVLLVLVLYVIARAALASAEFPETSALQWNEARLMAAPALLLLVAWWLRGDPRRVRWFLVAALLGLLTEFLLAAVSDGPQFLSAGRRSPLGYTELAAALYGGVALLGVLAFLPRWWRWLGGRQGWTRPVLRAVPFILLLVLIQGQLMTQSRAVWLGLAVLVPAVLVASYLSERRAGVEAGSSRRVYMTAVLVLGVAVALGVNTIERRLAKELPDIRSMVQSDFQEVPTSSIGYRVMLNRFGLELIGHRPWLGWGPGTHSTDFLVERFDRDHLDSRGDLHNLYLEIPVRLGSLGAALYVLLVILLLRSGLQGFRAGRMSRDLFVFLTATLLLTAGWSLINERLTNADFRVFIAIVFAVMHTFTCGRPVMEEAPAGAAARQQPNDASVRVGSGTMG